MPVVKMKIALAAVNFSYAPGDLIMVNSEVADEWIRIGHADLHEEKPMKLADLHADSEPEADAEIEVEIEPEIEAEEEQENDAIQIEKESKPSKNKKKLETGGDQ